MPGYNQTPGITASKDYRYPLITNPTLKHQRRTGIKGNQGYY